ncbi:MAG: hypothetical protein K2K17_09355, partial [Lachnospiraceae bacterium]|nr:hypothetical protein [Lachnospiraceae bacterium]
MKSKKSFSDHINQLIGMVFGIAFFVVFTASVILLYLSEDEIQRYYIKILGIFFIYLILYVFSTFYISRRIRKMFEPLDQFAAAFAEDKIRIYGDTADLQTFAKQLTERMDEMEGMSDALSIAEGNLNNLFQESEESRSRFSHHMKRCKGSLDGVKMDYEQLAEQMETMRQFLEEGNAAATRLKLSRQSLSEDYESIRESLQGCSSSHQEMMDDKDRQKEAFGVLNDMQKESMELIETIYNELAYIQNIASKLELYAANVSLDYARSGGGSLNISAALDEIKLTDRQMRDKIDELALLVIRTKNAIKLANDQTNFCIELEEDGQTISGQADEQLGFISMKLQGLMQVGEDISNGIAHVMNHNYE